MLCSRRLKDACRSDDGAVAIIFALCVIPLMALIGAAVDGVRWQSARQKTAIAIDSAVLVGARHMQATGDTAAALQAARDAYAANIIGRAAVASDTVDFAMSDNNTAVVSTGESFLQTAFLPVVGIEKLALVSQAKATYVSTLGQGSNLEVALMLDVTGSMCNDGQGPCTSGTKLDGLRQASEDLVNIVLADNTNTVSTSRIAVVPFSTRIRVEPDSGSGARMTQLTNMPATWSGWMRECVASTGTSSTTESNGNWVCTQVADTYRANQKIMPCVAERVYGSSWNNSDVIDYTDDAPGPGAWLTAHGGDRAPYFYDSTDNIPVPSANAGGSASEPATHWNYASGGYCADVPDSNEVIPLSADKTMLRARLQGLQAGGATSGAAGTVWAWYMLSPKWAGIWTGGSAPGSYSDLTTMNSYGAPKLRKVAVLMSDGVYNALRSVKDWPATQVSNHAKQVCTAMKAAGIEIYSVAFDLDSLPATDRAIAEDVLKSCGTDLNHFYSTLTVAELKAAFRDIALKVSPIRLTQ
jgi:Flp pilus assembly protein TadG